ncbi:diguanylate cyclase domain-containing protein [Rhodopseudomonas sp. NSM]|uniref:diguanylate cyclase domain-containing protein n=1 Tax=Rhodopseudomonas sp. NSM TaxID=3457630 RepID=UPI004036C2C7
MPYVNEVDIHPIETGEAGHTGAMARAIAWLVNGPRCQPQPITRRLLLHSQTKARSLVLAILSTVLLTIVAATMTGAAWAYTWLGVELAFGVARYAALRSLIRAQAAGRAGNAVLPLYIGLSWGVSYAIGCAMCVVSGEWPLILLAGMVIAGLAGGISSRNAGTPRYGITLIYILGLPYTCALALSPIPHMYVVGILVPLWGLGMALVLMENYQVLLNLFLKERENQWLANYDPLTGLPNRTMQHQRFEHLLQSALSTPGRGYQPLTVFCLDLDGFKAANDCYGHALGDAVLVVVAERLRHCVRDHDLIFRVGGDEFVILLPATNADESTAIARRVIARIAEPFDLGREEPLTIGVSIGSATFPRDGSTVDALLRAADSAMYEAKRQGKGIVVQCDGLDDAIGLVPEADANSRAARRVWSGAEA